LDIREINAWNPDRGLKREGKRTVAWDSVTAGNFGGFDVWLDEGPDAEIVIETNYVHARLALSEIDADDYVIPAGGLDLEIRLFHLPGQLRGGPISASVGVPIRKDRDNPLWIRVTTEDGFQAWTSPAYLFEA
jgi:hypothetical protein